MTEIDGTRLGREIAAHVLDAFNAAGFGDALAERVADLVARKVNTDVEMFSMQGWHQEYVDPPWSGWCWFGDHERCNGTAVPSKFGCTCPHHRGEQVAEFGYVLELRERTAPHPFAEGGGQS